MIANTSRAGWKAQLASAHVTTGHEPGGAVPVVFSEVAAVPSRPSLVRQDLRRSPSSIDESFTDPEAPAKEAGAPGRGVHEARRARAASGFRRSALARGLRTFEV